MGAATPASAGGSGGAYASDTPVITELACIARCASMDALQAGSLLRVRGRAMRAVRKIVFLGARGAADDVSVAALRSRLKSADVVVPERALSGPLMALNDDGAESLASRAAVSIQRPKDDGAPLEVKVVGRRVFLAAARHARLDLLARESMSVAVALVRLSDGVAVQGWPLVLAPGVVSTVTWDGTVGGVAQPVGRYEFRVVGQSAGAQAAQVAAAPLAAGSFDLVDHKFPIRGPHSYGTQIATFGSARNGHSHQGQDVFADCGTPLVAARGGIVKLNQHEGNAGNYLVIDGAGADVDYAYMHLQERSLLNKGAVVMTGQVIGAVGDTGDARGCHLHFEMWSAPGWYTGGQPFDPLAALRLWDAYS